MYQLPRSLASPSSFCRTSSRLTAIVFPPPCSRIDQTSTGYPPFRKIRAGARNPQHLACVRKRSRANDTGTSPCLRVPCDCPILHQVLQKSNQCLALLLRRPLHLNALFAPVLPHTCTWAPSCRIGCRHEKAPFLFSISCRKGAMQATGAFSTGRPAGQVLRNLVSTLPRAVRTSARPVPEASVGEYAVPS